MYFFKNDAFDAKIVNTRLTKIFIAIFAPDNTFHSIYMYFLKYILSLFQMLLHSAGLIQVRMIDIFSFHSFLCNNFSASRLSSHFHFLILMEPTLPLMFSNMIYFFKGKKLYTLHQSTSIFLLIQYLWTLPTRANLWQKYPKVSVLRYSKIEILRSSF